MKHLLEIHTTQLKSIISKIKDNRENLKSTSGTIHGTYSESNRCIHIAITKLEEAELWLEQAIKLD